MFEESRLAQLAAGPDIERPRRRDKEFLREVRRQNNERATCEAQRNGADMESSKSKTSEEQQFIRELQSEILQLQASAVPPDLTQYFVIQDMMYGMNRQEATSQSHKVEMKSLQRDLDATHDSLNNWDESNLDSTQGVYVGDSIGHRYHQ